MDNFWLMALIFFASALFHGTFGFGMAILATPLLSLFLPAREFIPLITIQALFINSLIAFRSPEPLRPEYFKPFLYPFVPALITGLYLLHYLPEFLIRLFLAGLIFFFVFYRLRNRWTLSVHRSFFPYVLGFLSTATGAAFNINGPLAIMLVFSFDWPPGVKKKVLVTYFLFSGVIVAAGHYLSGISNLSLIRTALLLSPVTLTGTWAGMKLFTRLHPDRYERLVTCFLAVMAVLLIV